MKSRLPKAFYLKALSGIVAFSLSAAVQVFAQNSNTFSRPGFTMEYKHNGTAWVHIANTTTTYNSMGQSLEDLSMDPVTNQNKSRLLQTYDSHGNRLTFHTYQWINNTWQLGSAQIDSFNYSPTNKIASQYIFDGKVTPKEKFSKYENTYDSNDNLIEEIYSYGDNGTWVLGQKMTLTYNSNNILTQKQYYQPNNGTWNLMRTETFSGWHSPTIPTIATTTYPNSSSQRRETFTMGQNGSYVQVTESFHGPTNTWRNMSRYSANFDAQNNYIGSKMENFSNNAWQNAREDQYLYTYNSQFDITEVIFRYPDHTAPSGTPAKDQDKYVYSNFQYFTRALGTLEVQKTALALNVFPNPATDKIQIELADEKPQTLTATLTDVTGKTWQTKTFKPSDVKQLDIEALPKGVYLLQLQTESGTTVKRIIKQ